MIARASLLILIFALRCFGQVSVEVKTSKPGYLVGEPVFVVVDVKNVGTEPVGYSGCDGHADLTVQNVDKKSEVNLWGCFSGVGGGIGCGIDHPPLMKPGETVTFQYLLKDYRLGPGSYRLQAKGKAGVRWKTYGDARTNLNPSPAPPQHHEGEKVDGAEFDVVLPLTVSSGDAETLQAAYARYVALAQPDGSDPSRPSDLSEMWRAREAIAEMAPEFLEKTIAGFASGPNPTPDLALKGLGQIPTSESRADLIKLYDSTQDTGLRSRIVEALAHIASPDELRFFAGMLPAGGDDAEKHIGEWSALGLGHIGGETAVEALADGFSGSTPSVRRAIAAALGNTRSSAAVPVLIGVYGNKAYGDSDALNNQVCGALEELTHYIWCDGTGTETAALKASWQKWWTSRGPEIEMHGTDDCPNNSVGLPAVPLAAN